MGNTTQSQKYFKTLKAWEARIGVEQEIQQFNKLKSGYFDR